MLVQFSVWPMDSPHISEDVADVTRTLDEAGVRYEVGPMGTTIDGEWEEVMRAVGLCHAALRARHQRLLSTITIDDDSTRSLDIQKATAKVTARRLESTR